MTKNYLLMSLLLVPLLTGAREYVVESARDIPLAYEADVVVVGGTVGAVTAAIEAANEGASVFLAAPRPYLGEDVAGTLRLWLKDGEVPQGPLEQQIFDRSATPALFANRLPYTYETDVVANPKHPDRNHTVLSDGKWSTPNTESVQYNEDVTIVADLGRIARVKALHLVAFLRTDDFELGDMQVWTSPNGKLWRDLGEIKNDAGGNDTLRLTKEIKQPSRFIKLLVKRKPGLERVLLGELVITEDGVDAVAASKIKHQPPTPMQVKVALDQALIHAGVRFLYGCPVTDVLKDASGNIAGIVMANRSGRQAVKAKVVIDATTRGSVAEMAGATFRPFSAGEQRITRVVVGGTPADTAEAIGAEFQALEGPQEIYQHTLAIPMKGSDWPSYMEAEHIARDQSFDVGVYDEADSVFMLQTDSVTGVGQSLENLSALTPKGVEYLYVLGNRMDVPLEDKAKTLRPLAMMRLGTVVGRAAAVKAKSLADKAAASLRVAGEAPDTASSNLQVKEFLDGARPTVTHSASITSAARKLPVLASYDVVIVGGGTGGAPAAIGAARKGAKTLLIEYQDHLGGVGTLGLISSYYHGYRKGFTSEVDTGVKEMGGPPRKGGWNPVAKREWWRSEIRKAGGDIWFSTLGCGAVVEETKVVGVVVVTPFGRGVIMAKSVIDSTGNSDIAVAAGAGFITTSAEHVAMQGTGLSPKSLGAGYTNTDYSFSDESDPVDQWRMIVSARKKYQNKYDLSTFIDSRERRRIVGEVFITPLDIINDKKYEDTVSLHQSNFDTHGYTVHPIFLINFPDKKGMTARVPYRAMLPKGVEGVLVTGLGMSAHRDSMPILRMQACIQNQGYAAGWAAASVAAENTLPRDVNIRALQEHLVEVGSLPAAEVGTVDSSAPGIDAVEAAVQSVVKDYKGLAVLLEQKELALPLLRKAFTATEPGERKRVYANILGMLGDGSGAGVLAETVQQSDWDTGWNFRGMGQFGGSISRLDSHIIALGRSGDAKGRNVILDKVATLDASKEFSHHRAVAMALEEHGKNSAAAEALAKLLAKDGMTGYAILDVTPGDESRHPGATLPAVARNYSCSCAVSLRGLPGHGRKDFADVRKRSPGLVCQTCAGGIAGNGYARASGNRVLGLGIFSPTCHAGAKRRRNGFRQYEKVRKKYQLSG